jgi:hypothetical protein
MLVLQPKTSTKIAGPLGLLVHVKIGVLEMIMLGVFVALKVAVEILGVAEALVTPMTTGVAVNIDGEDVGGRNGVGGLPGNG